MMTELCDLAEHFVTVAALEWLCAMCANMRVKTALSCRLVRLLNSGVTPLAVQPQRHPTLESFTALGAKKRCSYAVRSHVNIQRTSPSELLSTFGALMRFFTSVYQHMTSQS